MNDLLAWIAIGLAAVVIARYVLRTRQPLGFIATLLLGVGGAVAGGFLAQHVDVGIVRQIWYVDWISLVITVVGAYAVILIIGILRR